MQTRAITNLEYALDVAAARHEVIGDNIANIHTPKYRRREVLFKESLKQALGETTNLRIVGTNERHIGSRLNTGPIIKEVRTSIRQDGNNVDLEYENAALAKNTVFYQVTSQVLSSQFRMLQYAISEGRR
ncbi:MAG: flagellar basal body rod protein FlgB [Limnochordia bacterium]|jgi:flagellar basal-body rod protein FlgB|nr:flagellar basal body rod protein FlgB [Limnochordia bacterium]MDD2629373.1 flagellar basal body rod protein FlgB [Limnochordia bacterium]